MPDWDAEIDARGLLCPLPVLRLRKRLSGLAPGRVVRLIATDAAAAIDVPHYCREAGHELLDQAQTGPGEWVYLVRCGQACQD